MPLKPKITVADLIRAVNELNERLEAVEKLIRQHDGELNMITDMISEQIPTSNLDS